VAVPLANFFDGILLCELGNFLEGIFFLLFENFLEGILAIKLTWNRNHEKMARRPESGEPIFSCRNAVGRHYVRGPAFDPRYWSRLVRCVLRQHQRQDVRNVLYVAGAITTVISNCQAREHGNLPKDDPRMPAMLVF